MTTIFALLAASAFAQVPAGQPVSPAVNVDITPEGFDAVESLVPMFVPSGLALPFIESFSGECFWGVGTRTGIQLSGAQVSLAVNDVQIVPVPPTGYCGAGAQLDLHLSADIWLNDASTPFALYIEALCFGDTCDSWIDPFTALVDATVCVDLVTDPVTGALTLDASVDPDSLVVNLEGPGGLNGDDIHLNNCVVGDILGGLNLYDLVLPLLTGQIDSLLADQVASINESIADAVGGIGDSLVIAESFEVMEGSAIDLYLAPAAIGTDYNGLRFQLEGSAEAPLVHDCIARWDNGTSLETPSATPGVGEIPAVLSEPYHVSATIADEFVNQLFYAVWQTGILCQTLGGPGEPLIDLPLPVDSSLLGILMPGVFDEQFPEPGPILLVTRPEKPPVLNNQPDDIDVEVEDLGLEVYFDKDGRKAKLVDVTLGLDVGLATDFDPATGVLAIDIGLTDALSARVNQNEFEQGTDAQIQAGLEGLLSNPAISDLITNALAGLAGIGMPPIGFDTNGDGLPENFGVTDLVLTTAGSGDDWLGAYVWVGPVTYEYAGCGGGCGGCGGSTSSSSGCGSSSGCALGGSSGCSSGGCSSGASGCGGSTPSGGPPTGGCNLDSGSGGCGGSGGSGGSCNVSGADGGRAMLIAFAALLFLRRRQA